MDSGQMVRLRFSHTKHSRFLKYALNRMIKNAAELSLDASAVILHIQFILDTSSVGLSTDWPEHLYVDYTVPILHRPTKSCIYRRMFNGQPFQVYWFSDEH